MIFRRTAPYLVLGEGACFPFCLRRAGLILGFFISAPATPSVPALGDHSDNLPIPSVTQIPLVRF
jgi:hypothetical protein